MNLLKPLLSSTALTALAFVPVSANAQPMAPFSWTGFYAGLNAGGAWAESTWADAVGTYATPSHTNRPAGFVGGFQIGYNWQTGTVVFGLEGDVDFLSASKNALFGVGPSLSHNSRISTLATLRGRVGVAMDHTLLYVTGGAAVASIKNQFIDPAPPVTASRSSPTWGWAAGAGIEYAFSNAWSAKIEYIYAGFPTERVAISPLYTFDFKDSVSILRGGINYHF